MRKTLTIATSEIFRNGVSGNKAWELRNVTDSEGVKYSTFASLFAGQTYDVEVVQEKSTKYNPRTNQPYMNNKIAKVYGARVASEGEEYDGQFDAEKPAKENKEDQILKGLREIYAQNTKILERLDGLEGVNQ